MLTVIVLLCITAYGAVAGPIVPRNNAGGYRLSGDIVPSEYDIHINVLEALTKLKEPWHFQGNVTIIAKSVSTNPITDITLHASNMNISAVEVNGQNIKEFSMDDKKHEFLNIKLNTSTPIESQGDVKIIIKYNSALRDDMYGFYISSYKNKDNPKIDE